jgi:ribosomal-protein-alanine N-acetyltransferase
MDQLRPSETMETQRLILRRPRPEDAPLIFERYHQDTEASRYLRWRPASAIDQTNAFLQRCQAAWESGETFPLVITLKGDNRPIGMIELRPKGHSVEIAYVLARAYWNRGYVRKAVRTVVDWVLNQPSVYRVWAVCDVENAASARVLEKAGFQREGILRRWSIHPNVSSEPRDCFCYAIIK